MPILGSLAGASARGLGGLVTFGGDLSSFFPIATTTLATAASSVTFSSIPATFTHLHIRGFGKYSETGQDRSAIHFRYNSDAGSNYNFHTFLGTGSNITGDQNTSQTRGRFSSVVFPSSNANFTSIFGSFVADIVDYADTTKYKTSIGTGGYASNGASLANVQMSGSTWMSTAAISSITITPDSGNWTALTQFALYGIKG